MYTAIMINDGTGRFRIRLLPRIPNASGNPQIGLPSVYMNARPRTIVMSASVTMKGVILNLVMNSPATEPDAIPVNTPQQSAAAKPSAGGSGDLSTLVAITPLSATRAPTERSIPAVRITNVIPAPMMAVIYVGSETLRMLSAVKKNGESCEKSMISMRSAIPIPNSPVILASPLASERGPASTGMVRLGALSGGKEHHLFLGRLVA